MKDNFEKSMQSLFEHPPEVSFDEDGWKRLESRLKESKSKRKFGLWIWLPLILGAASALFALGYTYAKNNIMLPVAKVTQLVPSPNKTLNKKQTTSVKEIVVVHDTIIQTIVKYTTVPQKKSTLSLEPISPLLGASFYQMDLDPKSVGKKSSILAQSRIWAANKTTDAHAGDFVRPSIVSSIGDINPQFIRTTEKNEKLSLSPVFMVPKGNSASYYLRKLIPNDFEVTAFDAGFINLNFRSPAGTQKNTLYGVRAKLNYWRKWSAIIGFESLKSTFDIYADRAGSEEVFANLPVVSPTTPGDMLHEIVGKLRYFQIPVGLQLDVPIKGSFEAFVGAGVAFQKTRTSILTYDYFSLGDEYEIAKNQLTPPSFKLNSYWTETGVRFYVSSRWSMEAAVGGQFSFKNKLFKHESLNYLKWHLGVGFDF